MKTRVFLGVVAAVASAWPAAALEADGKRSHQAARQAQKADKKDSAQAAVRPEKKRKLALSRVLDRMQRVIDGTTSFTADFEQVYQSAVLGFGEEELQQGKVSFRRAKPLGGDGHIRWDYVDAKENPTKAFIVDGGVLWIVDHRKRQAHVNRCFRQDSLSAPLTFLWGRGKLKQTFEARWFDPNFPRSNLPLPGEKEKKDSRRRIQATSKSKAVGTISTARPNPAGGRGDQDKFVILLTPKQPCGVLRELIVTVDDVSFQILGTELADPSGNRNRFTYRNLRRNVVLGDATFIFRPPKGMKVFPIPGSCSPQNPSPAQSKATPRR
ncbi:MAG: outer membrane lipoprotein carrier protein LolA [Myxococcota bacterium]